jgi:hypothetical protein
MQDTRSKILVSGIKYQDTGQCNVLVLTKGRASEFSISYKIRGKDEKLSKCSWNCDRSFDPICDTYPVQCSSAPNLGYIFSWSIFDFVDGLGGLKGSYRD